MDTITAKHIGAYGIIIDNNKIALVRKARGGYKGKLDLPGGGIEHTELPNDTLIRELKEEADVEVTNFSLLDVTATNIVWQMEENLMEDLHHIGILYLVTVSGTKLKSDADGLDSEGCEWYEINDLTRDELSPFTIYALEKLGYSLNEKVSKKI